ncbi:MAG: 3-phosphoshikimate 1-carboxyvinyltransferase [Chitinophagia bacterium]|nr:3-phosphoshikimate 1-carboxyvinyltransferase [Chitinophagia bacterium]
MRVKITASELSGVLQAPASKSSMQRACAAALLHEGETLLLNPGHSNDDLAALDVIQKLGATVKVQPDHTILITSKGIHPQSTEINCGESGLGIRMFTPIAAISSLPLTIAGSGSLVTRPMHFFDEIFPLLGVSIQSNEGKLPLKIQGPLKPVSISVDGSLSSQFLTGLLMAFGSANPGNAVINVKNLASKPYIDLTIDVMRHFGKSVIHQQYASFSFQPASIPPPYAIQYTVEGDWSSISFLLVAGAIAGSVKVTGVSRHSTQADKAILFALEQTGCTLIIGNDYVETGKGNLRAFHFDATHCPDLFPPLVSLAACCSGTSVIKGISRLAHKESNRALTLQQEFAKLGVDIELVGDDMMITGGKILQGTTVHSHHDHRIAMACAVAALRTVQPVDIMVAEAINKSYPDFFQHLAELGAGVEIIEQ